MARRLGTSGYYVMLPNMYYRSGVMELGPIPPDPEAPERKAMFGFMNSIDIPMVMEDTKALLAFAETQEAANTKIVGTVGYCMSGRYAVNAATHFPDRVKAAASVYGTHLATDQPDSPHLAAAKTRAELYFACAETDIYAPQEIIDKVAAGMKGSNNEVEVYPGTHHGFAFPKRPVYHRDAAERHWERLLALYRRNLVPGEDQFERPRCRSFLYVIMPFPVVRSRSPSRSGRGRDPLVCAGLYRRHRAGMDLRPRAGQEGEAMGRPGADHAGATRRLYPVGHHRHHRRRPHRIRAVLQSRLLHPAPGRDFRNCGRAACRFTAAFSAASPR